MTIELTTDTRYDYAAPTGPEHPQRSLSPDEFRAVREIVVAAGLATSTTKFAYVGVDEPHKREVLDFLFGGGPRPERLARVMLLDGATGASTDVVVSLDSRTVVRVKAVEKEEGHLPVLDSEYESIPEIMAGSDEYRQALAARGVDIEQVVYVPLSPGNYAELGGQERRLLRAFAFRQDSPSDNPYAHPIDGLCAWVDTISREVVRIVEYGDYPVSDAPANYDDPQWRGAEVEGLKPIEISQPQGPSFTVRDGEVSWANWRLGFSFDIREGLILHDVRHRDTGGKAEFESGRYRPVMHRASISEMVVPYGDPSPTRYWQNYFDTGEYNFARYANSLELGCDCVGDITYFDAVVPDEIGMPRTIKNAICMHEEDYGTLWKHNELFTGMNEVRRQRRLVISFFTTIGNYDYGFYWYLYLDGTIECEAKLTGSLFTSAQPTKDYPYGSEVAPGVGAPNHQHLFGARLDMLVDGVANAVDEVDAVRLPISATNPAGNAITKRHTRIRTEGESGRFADGAVGRSWHVISTERTNVVGGPTGYALIPQHQPTLLAADESVIAARAAFTTRHLWVTRYDPDERYAAGDYVNMSPSVDPRGIPTFVKDDESVDGEDIVLWHTFGPTHFPRIEDYPIMPVDTAKFTLKPYGFFNGSPVMNVPAEPAAAHGACHAHGHGDHAAHDDHGATPSHGVAVAHDG